MSVKFGTKAFDVLGYTCEFSGRVTADDIACEMGMTVDAVRMTISRLRQHGLVQKGSPYRATKQGRERFEAQLADNGVLV